MIATAFCSFILGCIFSYKLCESTSQGYKKKLEKQSQSIQSLQETINVMRKRNMEKEEEFIAKPENTSLEHSLSGIIKDIPTDTESLKSLKAGWVFRAKKAGLSEKATIGEVLTAEQKKKAKHAKKANKKA